MVAIDDRAPEIETDSPPFTVSVRLEGDLAISVVSGELDMATAPGIRQNLEPFKGRVKAVAYELGNISFIDAAGLNSLRFSINHDGTGVSIRNPSRAVRRVLELIQLEGLIERPIGSIGSQEFGPHSRTPSPGGPKPRRLPDLVSHPQQKENS